MKENPEPGSNNLSRRNFIKNASVGAGAAAIASLSTSEAKAIAPEQVPEWNYEADVVILGTGFAGQVSAIVSRCRRIGPNDREGAREASGRQQQSMRATDLVPVRSCAGGCISVLEGIDGRDRLSSSG